MRLKKPEQIRNPALTRAYCIAYLEFEREADAALAIRELNGLTISGNTLSVDIYDKAQQDRVNISVADVVNQQILKGLFITGIDRNVRSLPIKQCKSIRGLSY